MDSNSALSQGLDDCPDSHGAFTQADITKPFRPVHDRLTLSQPEDDVMRDGALEQDLVTLSDLYLSTGDISVFEKALVIAMERLVVHEHAGTDLLADSSGAVSDLWHHRYEHTSEQEAMDKAMEYSRQRLNLLPGNHYMRGTSLQGLACLLTMLARDTSSEDIIEEALQYFQEALVLFPASHQDYQVFLFDYAAAWSVHNEITGDPSGLKSSITLFEQLLETQKPGNLARAATLEQYASTLDDLYYATNDISYLFQALSLYHEAMDYYADDDSNANTLFMNTGLAHWNHFEQSKDISDLDEAIRLLRHALQLSPSGVERARVLFNLGESFLARYLQHRDEDILQEARLAFGEAIQIFHHDHPMSMKCHARLSECYSSWYSSHQDLDKTTTLLLHAVAHTSSPPSDRLDYCWSAMEEIREALEVEDMTSVSADVVANVAKIYQHLTELLPRVANFGRDLEGRLGSLRKADDIGIGASWHTLQLTYSDAGSALEYLEAARGIFWTQALNLRSANLDILPSEVKEELQQLLNALENGTYIPRVSAKSDTAKREVNREAVIKRKKAARVDEILSGIRQQPGLERFMLGADSASLVSAASTSIVVVLIPGETFGTSEAIVLQPGVACTARRVSLAVNGEDLEEWTAALKESQWRQRCARPLAKNRLSLAKAALKPKASKTTHNLILSQLWSDIVKPVLDALQLQPTMGHSRPRLHWCPAGLFAFLPLHAAGAYNDPDPSSTRAHVFDYVVSSYIPTLSALMKAQTEFSALSLKGSTALLVAEGATPGLAPLPSVKRESIVVRDILLKSQVQVHLPSATNQTTKAAVTARLSNASIAHFACHGIQDAENPLNSGFCLRDGVLTIAELMRFNLPKAVFAFLSACETAQGDRDQPNQAIHLCAALLFCGFKSVIGTMWGMSDEDGPFVAAAVYRELCAKDKITADDIAYALDTAVGELRAQNVGPDRWAPFVHIGA